MPTLLCTEKYRKTFGLSERLPLVEVPEGALGPWYANILNAGAHRMLHFMSATALLSVVIPQRERKSAEHRLVIALGELLRGLKVPEAYITREAELLKSFQHGRASDRSKLASMRDLAYSAKHYVQRGQSIQEVNLYLAEAPCGPMSYAQPKEVAPARLEAAWRQTGG